MRSAKSVSAPAAVTPALLRRVLLASSVGTIIEWYDFFIFGSLASLVIGPQFFPKNDNPLLQTLEALATFAAGFVVRPFGALFFGRLGDLVGRKHTFLLTLLLMGGSTFAITFLPNFSQIGFAAPALLVLLRLVQGLALGGEYGGATTYVAEHTPDNRRGFYTSLLQLTATIGLILSISIILICRVGLTSVQFQAWGWRIPFAVSGLLVVVSYFIRRRLGESPVFAQMKAAGTTSQTPLRDSFVNPENRRLVLLSLFGLTMGYGCAWYAAHFYSSVFIGTILKVDFVQTNIIMLIALVLATPFAVVFGNLSDKIGRKRLMLTGLALVTLSFYPIYQQMSVVVDYSHKAVIDRKISRFTDVQAQTIAVTKTQIFAGGTSVGVTTTKGKGFAKPEVKTEVHLTDAARNQLIFLVWLQVFFVTLAYGPIAAYLVELFPARIRYTSLSLPYHIGNGIFGGMTPFVATALISVTGNSLAGLLYPLSMAGLTTIIGAFLLPETNKTPNKPAPKSNKKGLEGRSGNKRK